MNLDLLREMIDRHEGNRLKKYRCPSGHWTVGRGWNIEARLLPADIGAHLRLYGTITPEMSDRLLNIAIDTTIRQCKGIWPTFDDFTGRRQMALVDFVYNVGAGTTMKFKKALAAIDKGDWSKAAEEFQDSEWFRQVGTRGYEIIEMIQNG